MTQNVHTRSTTAHSRERETGRGRLRLIGDKYVAYAQPQRSTDGGESKLCTASEHLRIPIPTSPFRYVHISFYRHICMIYATRICICLYLSAYVRIMFVYTHRMCLCTSIDSMRMYYVFSIYEICQIDQKIAEPQLGRVYHLPK